MKAKTNWQGCAKEQAIRAIVAINDELRGRGAGWLAELGESDCIVIRSALCGPIPLNVIATLESLRALPDNANGKEVKGAIKALAV